ncbi:MAG: hypothetical protein ACYC1L_19420 [Alphaproteobacteria bacterium]
MPNFSYGYRAKIKRANEGIKYLHTELEKFLSLKTDHYRTVIERKDDTREFILRAFGDPLEISPELRVLMGEIIHNLRTSLDHLVCALVLRENSEPSWGIQFPICDTTKEFERACQRGKIKGISDRHMKIIESIQPYWTSESGNHPLSILRRLNNADKHRLLIGGYGVMVSPHQFYINPGSGRAGIASVSLPRAVLPTENGVEVSRISFVNMNADMEVKFNTPVLVPFMEFGTVKTEPIIPGLVKLRDAVTNTIDLF